MKDNRSLARVLVPPFVVACLCLGSEGGLAAEVEKVEGKTIAVVRDAESVRFLSRDAPVARYRYGGAVWKSYLAELSVPGGPNVLRDAPADHLHHHGLMFACRVDGVNFWEERKGSGREAHVEFEPVKVKRSQDGEVAVLQEKLAWRGAAGRTLLLEERTLSVPPPESSHQLLLWEARLTVPPGREKATLSGTLYNGLGLRLLGSMDRAGRHFSASGGSGVDGTNGKAATWCAYSAEAAPGTPVTVAVLDAPANPRHPSDWYTMTDPFAYLSATQSIGAKPLTIRAGRPLVLRFAVVVFHGRVDPTRVEKVYRDVARRFWGVPEDRGPESPAKKRQE